jgi:hypothetical protein
MLAMRCDAMRCDAMQTQNQMQMQTQKYEQSMTDENREPGNTTEP